MEHHLLASFQGAPGTAVVQAKNVRPCNSKVPSLFFLTSAPPAISRTRVSISFLEMSLEFKNAWKRTHRQLTASPFRSSTATWLRAIPSRNQHFSLQAVPR